MSYLWSVYSHDSKSEQKGVAVGASSGDTDWELSLLMGSFCVPMHSSIHSVKAGTPPVRLSNVPLYLRAIRRETPSSRSLPVGS